MKEFKKFPDELDKISKRYIKKPIPVRAVQIHEKFSIQTLEGVMNGKSEDYLIEGIDGEVYPCDRTIFEKTYVEDNDKKGKKKC